jgi:hypothetical protein
VSLPQDGDVRAKYGLFTWKNGNRWVIEHRYISYDIDAEVALLNRLKPPKWEVLTQRLQTANTGNLIQTDR